MNFISFEFAGLLLVALAARLTIGRVSNTRSYLVVLPVLSLV